MHTWFVTIVSLCFAAALIFRKRGGKKLPPGPSFLSSNFILLTNSLEELYPIIRYFKSKYGPIITFSAGSRPYIFVGSQDLAHELLIKKGLVVCDRPRSLVRRTISSTSYGPTWKVLRHNLASEILQPLRIKSYSYGRKWVLHILISRLQQQQKEAAGIKVVEHFQHAMFCLLVLICFGEKLDEHRINDIISTMRRAVVVAQPGGLTVYIFSVFPKLGKILFRKRWNEFWKIRNDLEQLLVPLIKSRIEATSSKQGGNQIVAYVDALVNIQLPKEEANNGNGGKLTHSEMVNMCTEILSGGSDTTFTALQWIMANLVKYPNIQGKLFDEMIKVVGPPPPPPPPGVEPESIITEEDLQKMPYLKAVVLEGLRRHSPTPFLLPHATTEEVELQGFTIPEGATINFMVAEMGLDPKVWDDPMAFKPERFMVNGDIDITGRKGIKMMPFGAGRRMCPAYSLGLLHLEYFVANLIWYFQWTAPTGYHVDLSEKTEVTMVMKNPLQAKITSRTEKITT